MRAPTRIIDDGRVTIPADVRNDLELEKGDYVLIDVEPIEQGGSE